MEAVCQLSGDCAAGGGVGAGAAAHCSFVRGAECLYCSGMSACPPLFFLRAQGHDSGPLLVGSALSWRIDPFPLWVFFAARIVMPLFPLRGAGSGISARCQAPPGEPGSPCPPASVRRLLLCPPQTVLALLANCKREAKAASKELQVCCAALCCAVLCCAALCFFKGPQEWK